MQDQIVRSETCTLGAVRRVAAMLDLDPDHYSDGDPLPRGWHFILLGGETRRSALRGDGFPGFGVPMPDLGLPRLLLGGRRIEYRSDLKVGGAVHRLSCVESVKRKQTASGEMAIVTIHHELGAAENAPPAIVEEQTYVLLGAANDHGSTMRPMEPILGERTKVLVPDATLLFQYSALGFNSHKIHIDRAYARDVEGLPDLVVNGGLATLLLTEFMRRDLGLTPASITTKHTAALYCGRPMTLSATRGGDAWRLKVRDDTGVIAVDMEASV